MRSPTAFPGHLPGAWREELRWTDCGACEATGANHGGSALPWIVLLRTIGGQQCLSARRLAALRSEASRRVSRPLLRLLAAGYLRRGAEERAEGAVDAELCGHALPGDQAAAPLCFMPLDGCDWLLVGFLSVNSGSAVTSGLQP